jgi:hypothetical protein
LTAQQPTDAPHVGTVLLPGAIGDEVMTTNDPEIGPGLGPRKPRAELRHWSTYTSVEEWYADHRGYVPIQQAAALGRLTRDGTMSFRDAYRLLLRHRAIIHLDPADDIEPE